MGTALRSRGEEYVRRALRLARETGSIVEAVEQTLAPDALVYAHNGDVVTAGAAGERARSVAPAFPDMEMEFEGAWFPADHVVMRFRLIGTAVRRIPLVRLSYRYDVHAAFVGRVSADLTLSEVRPFLNPGFAFSYPPSGIELPPPPPDRAGEAEARALYARWASSAEAGDDFVHSITSSMAPRAVVHLANGDSGSVRSFERLFGRIASGLHQLTIGIDEVLFDGPHLVTPFRMTGVHRGRLGVFAPTGRVLPSTGLLLARADERGEAAELWLYVAPAYALAIPPGTQGRS